MSITLDLDEQALASLPLGPDERERLMQIELACRFYANGSLTLGMGARPKAEVVADILASIKERRA